MSALSRSMDEVPVEGSIDLHELVVTVRRRKWLVLSVTALAVAVAALYSYSRTPMYASTADLLVRPILTNPLETNPAEQISLLTEMRIVTSAAVADVASDLMGNPDDVATLMSRVFVTAPEDTQILKISYSDPDPGQARRGAQAFADAYLAFKSEQAVEAIARYTTTLQTEIDDLNQQLSELNRTISTLSRRSPQWEDQVNRRSAVETTRLALQGQLATLTTLSIDPGQVIQPADLPTSPSSPKHRLDLALGMLVGLVAGVGLAMVSERTRGGIGSQSALEELLEAPVLGVIPRVSAGRRKPARPVTVQMPRSVAAEAYRTLRTNVLAVTARPPVKSLLVTSAWLGEGKSTTAANLAAALAQLGKRVVLISADLRFPRVHTFFGVANERGLGQVLTGELPLAEALCETPVPDLRVIPSGPVTGIAEPVELLQSDRMKDVIARCGAADFVIVDGPPTLAVADSLVLATMLDAVLFVADARKGKRAALAQSQYQLRQVGARVLGGVLNGVEGWKKGRGGYGPYDYRRGLLYRILVPEPTPNGHTEPSVSELGEPRSG